ncbi:MAG: ISKra4 family transposase [Acidobacteriota bacterium]|nr:ISKra4 family transposase [Acidobacteriota bacterium]
MQEQVSRHGRGGEQVRPFVRAARVECRGYSLGLQRVVTDFGADVSFGRVPEKVREHYGIEVCASTVRAITEGHGAALESASEVEVKLPLGGVTRLLTEMDGSMVPTVQMAEDQGDQRRQRTVGWTEARLCLAGLPESVSRKYGATMGSVEEAGRQWKSCVVQAGGGRATHLHCVGDAASWIKAQAERQFGRQASYLVDFYHVSEYLAQAAAVVAPESSTAWLHTQQEHLQNNHVVEVLAALAPHGEAAGVPEAQAPVRGCERYLRNHLSQLDYAGAIAAGLPIGSGEIESSHRTIIQSRLKISGAWWKVENAGKMLALRVTRANQEWKSYWAQLRQSNA